MKRWGVHHCSLDRECRAEAAPPRLHVFTPWGMLTMATGRNGSSQLWLPKVGYTRWWSPIAWHPRCNELRGQVEPAEFRAVRRRRKAARDGR